MDIFVALASGFEKILFKTDAIGLIMLLFSPRTLFPILGIYIFLKFIFHLKKLARLIVVKPKISCDNKLFFFPF